jgi:hypothetical protein
MKTPFELEGAKTGNEGSSPRRKRRDLVEIHLLGDAKFNGASPGVLFGQPRAQNPSRRALELGLRHLIAWCARQVGARVMLPKEAEIAVSGSWVRRSVRSASMTVAAPSPLE